MIKRIDHISIAVRDQEKAKAFFVDILGGRELFCAPFEEQKYRWTTLEVGTSCFIELLDPLGSHGFVQRFLDNRGEGPHHITIQVDDLQEVHRRLESRGIPTFGYSESLPGWKEFFVHPRDAFGTLIQFAEFNPLDWINPGYIPPSYREFAPPEDMGTKEDQVRVERVETKDGPQVEIRQGEASVRVSPSQIENLIERLKQT